MKTYVHYTSAILIGCIICLIGSAWVHDSFLIGFSLTAIGICGYIFLRAVQFRDEEKIQIQELKRKVKEESDLQLSRELTWWEFINNNEVR